MAGIDITAADPGPLGTVERELCRGQRIDEAKKDPKSNTLIKAVIDDFESSEGRNIARDGLKAQLTNCKAAEIKAKCIDTLRQVGAVLDAKAPGVSSAGCSRSVSTLPRPPRRVDCSQLVAWQ